MPTSSTPDDDMIPEALDLATPTQRDFSIWLGVSYASVRSYSSGARSPSPKTVAKLATILRRQARQLDTMANRLERAADAGWIA